MIDQATREQIIKLSHNQNRIVEKLKELDFLVKAGNALQDSINKRLSGLETALLGAGVLNKDGLELHQSFKVDGATTENETVDNQFTTNPKETTEL